MKVPPISVPAATCYVVVWIDVNQRHGNHYRVVDVGLYSEETPTTIDLSRRSAVVFKVFSEDGFAVARRQALKWIDRDRRFDWIRPFLKDEERT